MFVVNKNNKWLGDIFLGEASFGEYFKMLLRIQLTIHLQLLNSHSLFVRYLQKCQSSWQQFSSCTLNLNELEMGLVHNLKKRKV